MRYVLDLALFAAVFGLALALFQSALHAALAGFIIAGAGDTLIWVEKKNR